MNLPNTNRRTNTSLILLSSSVFVVTLFTLLAAEAAEGHDFSHAAFDPPLAGCSYVVSPSSAGYFPSSHIGSISVTTQPECFWTVVSSDPSWLQPICSGGTGDGTCMYAVLQNSTFVDRVGTLTVAGETVRISQSGLWYRTRAYDFDADFKVDLSVYRPSTGTWYVDRSATGGFGINFGTTEDIPVSADYDGDWETDVAVYRPSTHVWYIFNSENSTITVREFGDSGDIPVPVAALPQAAKIAVFRPSTGTWLIDGGTPIQFGESGDIPVPGPYTSNLPNSSNLAVFRPSTGTWHIRGAADGIRWGLATDIVIPADYDGDGRFDVAVYRPSTGTWYILRSRDGQYQIVNFGISDDIPVPGDYDGDNKADIAIFRPSTGQWWIDRTQLGLTVVQYGLAGDIPLPGPLRH